ncbi:MAG TPA: Gfo/Idh/MocA family oxidoreductase [Bryobacteraceae bacterium]|jgi:predicted dehydrogenase|nr:Gfo/Idh/MocA family oxidoreductase [Bryobacteraceae bacterium]
MVKWLVIGIGDITRKRVLPAILAEPRSELYGLLTRHPAKAAPYAPARVFTSLDVALADPAIDAVYVASPVALHAPQTIAALRAGKHVLGEKPAALNYAEAQSMAQAARASGRLWGIAFYRRLYPKLLRTRELIAAGAIGQPVLAEANCHSWLPVQERSWLWDPALAGGGPLYDIASHRIDACNFFFGRPMRATGLLSNAVHRLGVEDSATVLIDYQHGIRGIVDVRWNSHIERDQFRVIGTDGAIDLDPLNGPTLLCCGREEHLPAPANLHFPAVANFAGAVADGTPVMCPGEEAIWTDWVTEEVMKSGSERPPGVWQDAEKSIGLST